MKADKVWRKEDGKRLCLGDEHTRQCAVDVLLSCTLEACLVLQTNVSPVNSFIHSFNHNKKTAKPVISLFLGKKHAVTTAENYTAAFGRHCSAT